MKRMHIHLGVPNLDKAIDFYTLFFGAQPVKVKSDYAKWMINDPRVNFAVSTSSQKIGLDHLGIQVEEEKELKEFRTRMKGADRQLFDEGETECCYSKSDKSWIIDPAGIGWETYRNMEDIEYFSAKKVTQSNEVKSCCAPIPGKQTCCE
ncbi:MAG: VOC family protein [Bdellovibrionales bacterium]|nr:VOC family protein [Bdellovibrionales bacterium]